MSPEAKAREILESIGFSGSHELAIKEITDVLRDVERETLERAAKVAEDYQAPGEKFGCDDWSDDTLSRQADIAQSIRSLLQKEGG